VTISEVVKMITEEQKYSGSGEDESLDHKLTIFYDICARVNLPQELYVRAFPALLKGLAQDHFYNNKLSQRNLDDMCTNLKNFFEGPGYHRRNLDKWNTITLSTVTAEAENSTKSTQECLQLLINKLRKLQYGLTPNLRTTEFLHNKLVTACQGIPACRYATADPPEDLGHLINKLQSSIMAYEKEHANQVQVQDHTQAYFTDRRYYRQNRYGNRRTRQDQSQRQGRCYICKRSDCRSWKHTHEEQEQSKAKFRARNQGKFNNKASDFNKRFDEGFRQYIATYEGEESDDDDDDDNDIHEAFGALTIDITPGPAADPGIDQPDKDSPVSYFIQVSHEATAAMAIELTNRAAEHSLTLSDSTTPLLQELQDLQVVYSNDSESRYNSRQFHGIMIDTGAAKRSTAGYGQFQALQRIVPVNIDYSTKGIVSVQFGIGSTSSIGSAMIHTPIGQVEFHIVEADTPFLLSLADMDKLQVYLNNLQNVLVTPNGNVPVVRRFGHSFLLWDTTLQVFLTESFDHNPCYLTNTELQRLHRRFGHPSVERLQRVLNRAGHDLDKKALEYLTRYCIHCQKHGKSPGRFKFTLHDDVDFNYCIIVDIMYIDSAPLIHIVDQATRFQAGRWLQNISAKHTWDTLRACWIDTYLGPPDLIAHDAGKNFVSKEFKQYASTMGITTKSAPVEAHNSVGMVERYHGPLRRIYQIITSEIKDIDKDSALQMAFKALNDTAGPNGLVRTLLVFGAYPRIVESDAPSPTVAQRAVALRKAMDEVKKLRANRQVMDALNMRNGPRVDAIHDLPLNSPVLVWREGNTGQNGHWSGPYNLIAMDGESCTVDLPYGHTTFRSTSVKPFLVPKDNIEEIELDSRVEETVPQPVPQSGPGSGPPLQPAPAPQPVKRGRGRPRKYPLPDITAFLQGDGQFATSRQSEVAGLLEKGVFEVVDPETIPKGVRLFNSRFVDEVKNQGTDQAFEKSRLVVQAYNDLEKDIVLTQSPTIQRVSQRLILCLAAMMPDKKLYLRDISQAYVQSVTKLNRDFYVLAPPELTEQLGIANGSILKVVKPLYGVPEAGNHWFKTYHSHHLKELNMDQSTFDPCLLYSNEPFGLVGLQTDDTLFLGDMEFATAEQDNLEKAQFLAKEREHLSIDKPIKFNGSLIQLDLEQCITLSQERQCQNLGPVHEKPTATTSSRGTVRNSLTPKEQYVTQRARGAYIASVCQPEASFDLSFAAQTTNPDENDIKALNKRLQWQIDNPTRGLKFVKLDKSSLKLLVFTDASFANNKDLSSQIGYVIVMADSNNRANIIHWSSIKCKRVTRSVLASELYAMTHGFDIGTAIKSTIDRILGINLPLVLCTDSKSLYDCLVKLGTTQEKRLMIDVLCLRQSYERREIAEVKWIKGNTNPADALTKSKGTSTALKQITDTNMVCLEAVEWVERTEMANGGTTN
jgi:hypothetical protein